MYIVFFRGESLHTHLHVRGDRFPMGKLVRMAQEIAQAVSYLHERAIIPSAKSLRTWGIFVENGRAVIKNFGLVNWWRRLNEARRTRGKSSWPVNKTLLCYLAPEAVKNLQLHRGTDVIATKVRN